MNYGRHYELLINKAKSCHRIKSSNYYENHHIIPKSLGGENKKNNMVLLTPREHFVAHHLLYKIYNNTEMIRAFYLMCKKNIHPSQNRNYNVTAGTYAEARVNFSNVHKIRMLGDKNPNYNVAMSEEQKNKIGNSNKGKRSGLKSSDETKKLQSIQKIGKIRGPNKKIDKRTGIPTGITPANKGKPSPLRGYPRGTKLKDLERA